MVTSQTKASVVGSSHEAFWISEQPSACFLEKVQKCLKMAGLFVVCRNSVVPRHAG